MLKILALDRFTILLIVMVILASILPLSGEFEKTFSVFTSIAIAILFFYMAQKFLERLLLMESYTGDFILSYLYLHSLYSLY